MRLFFLVMPALESKSRSSSLVVVLTGLGNILHGVATTATPPPVNRSHIMDESKGPDSGEFDGNIVNIIVSITDGPFFCSWIRIDLGIDAGRG